MKIQFPPPPRPKAEEPEDASESDAEEEEEQPEMATSVNDFSKNLRRAVSVMKHSRPDHHRRESDDIHPQDMVIVNSGKVSHGEEHLVRPTSPILEATYSPLVVSPTPKVIETPRIEQTVVLSTEMKETPSEAKPHISAPRVEIASSNMTENDTQAKLQVDCFARNPLVTSQSLETFRELSHSIENLKSGSASVGNLQVPADMTEPLSPTTAESRKVRRNNSITRGKKPTEFETERASHAGEQMRPKELQRRTSKSQKDPPSTPKPMDMPTEQVPSVASLKRSLTSISKPEVKRSEETLATSIHDKIKLFSGGQEPKIMKSHKKGPLAQ
jgi:hypothetical protein